MSNMTIVKEGLEKNSPAIESSNTSSACVAANGNNIKESIDKIFVIIISPESNKILKICHP